MDTPDGRPKADDMAMPEEVADAEEEHVVAVDPAPAAIEPESKRAEDGSDARLADVLQLMASPMLLSSASGCCWCRCGCGCGCGCECCCWWCEYMRYPPVAARHYSMISIILQATCHYMSRAGSADQRISGSVDQWILLTDSRVHSLTPVGLRLGRKIDTKWMP